MSYRIVECPGHQEYLKYKGKLMKQFFQSLLGKKKPVKAVVGITQLRQFIMMKVKTLFKHDDRYDDACALVCLLTENGVKFMLYRFKHDLKNAGVDAWMAALADTYRMGDKIPDWTI